MHGTDQPTRFDVPAYDARTLARVGHTVSVRGYTVRSVSITPHDARLLVATFAGARGSVSSLQFSRDGSTLVVTSADQAVQVYDVGSRLRLGDAIVSESPRTEGWLRPDAKAVAVNTRQGIAVWQINAKHLVCAACTLAGRTLSRTEWDTYLGSGTQYRATCPNNR